MARKSKGGKGIQGKANEKHASDHGPGKPGTSNVMHTGRKGSKKKP